MTRTEYVRKYCKFGIDIKCVDKYRYCNNLDIYEFIIKNLNNKKIVYWYASDTGTTLVVFNDAPNLRHNKLKYMLNKKDDKIDILKVLYTNLDKKEYKHIKKNYKKKYFYEYS